MPKSKGRTKKHKGHGNQPNAYLRKQNEHTKAMTDVATLWSIQMCIDLTAYILNNEFGFGEKRLIDFNKKFNEGWPDWHKAVTKDVEAGATRTIIDDALSKVFKESFIPWEERYYCWPSFGKEDI